ncbi:MAG: hypothetical protein Q8L04_06195 [Ignavibacteria bacterium]|nr:hypothetical protein [Ignavibacteria bacterium]
MNLRKLFLEELWSAVMIIILFGFTTDKETINNRWLVGLIYTIIIWAIYYFMFIRFKKEFKLDERELYIYTKIGYTSVFVFLSALTAIWVFQEEKFPFMRATIKAIWGSWVLPIFILIHAVTGLIYLQIESKND